MCKNTVELPLKLPPLLRDYVKLYRNDEYMCILVSLYLSDLLYYETKTGGSLGWYLRTSLVLISSFYKCLSLSSKHST